MTEPTQQQIFEAVAAHILTAAKVAGYGRPVSMIVTAMTSALADLIMEYTPVENASEVLLISANTLAAYADELDFSMGVTTEPEVAPTSSPDPLPEPETIH